MRSFDRTLVLLLALALTLALVGSVAGVAATDQQPPDRRLDGCTTISSPGRYVLGTDVVNATADTCLRITASDVLVDGAGHRVDGVGAFGSAGVLATGGSNVTVRNLTATDWDDGVRFVDVASPTVTGTQTTGNRVGLSLVSVRDGRFTDDVARSNAVAGVFLAGASRDNTLRNTTATANSLVGVQVVEARETTIAEATARDNQFGVALFGTRGTVLRDSVASGNAIAGVWLSAAKGSDVQQNSLSNRFYGVYLADGAQNNTVAANRAVDNPVGVRLRSSDGNAILDNQIRNSSDTAILLIESDRNRVVGNRETGNRRGVVVAGTENVVSNNSVGG